MTYRELARMLYDEPWLMLPRELELAASTLRRKRRGGARLQAPARVYGQELATEPPAGVAILPLTGMITAKHSWWIDWFGGTALERWVPTFEALVADESISTIVLDVDSPGGHVVGTAEAADRVLAARGKKQLIAVANGTICSGAYWIASACDEIVAGPSSVLGSIGAFSVVTEYSQAFAKHGVTPTVLASRVSPRKADGNKYEPLTKEARASLQERIDNAGEMFVAAVARHRGISAKQVLDRYGEGSWFYGAQAVERGLADRLGTLADVLAELGVEPGATTQTRAAARSPSISREEAIVNPQIIQALVAKGVLKAGATDAEAHIALAAWFAGQGKKVPAGDAAILSALGGPNGKAKAKAKGKAEEDDEDEAEGDDDEEDLAEEDEEDEAEGEDDEPEARRRGGKTRVRGQQPDVEAIRRQAAAESRQLVARIRAAGQALIAMGLPPEAIDTACAEQSSLKGAKAYFADVMAGNGAPVRGQRGGLTAGAASRDTLAGAITEVLEMRSLALLQRAIPREHAEISGGDLSAVAAKPLSPAAAQIRHKRLIDLVELSIESHGFRVDMGNPQAVMYTLFAPQSHMAAGPAGSYSAPSFFPNLLSNVAGKSAAVRLQFTPTTYRRWASYFGVVSDFKPKTIIGVGEYQELPRKNDLAEREQAKPIGEEPAWISVDEFGDTTPFSFRMLVDDDLNQLIRSIGDKQIAADRTVNRLCVELLTGNALAPDGNPLFDASIHKNLIASGTAPNATAMEAMDALLSAQKGIDQERTIAQEAKLLLHPNKHKYVVRKELYSNFGLVPTTKGELNVFRDIVEPVWEPMLTDADADAWYMFADPNISPAIMYAFMVGFEGGPRITQFFDEKTNVVHFATDLVTGVAINSYRPVAKNSGVGG